MIGVRAHDLGEFTIARLEEFIQEIKKYGFTHIQLVLWKSFSDIDPYLTNVSKDQLEMIAKRLKEESIKVTVLGAYYNMISPDLKDRILGEERYEKMLEILKIFNGEVVGTEPGSYNIDFSFNERNHSKESYNIVLDSFKKFSKVAEKTGTNMGLEPVYTLTIWNIEVVKKLFNDLNSKNFKIIFDPVNLIGIENYQQQDELIENMFEIFKDNIVTVHFKDFLAEDGKLVRVSPGKGILNYKLLLSKMKKYNINGILDEVPKEDLEFSKKYVENILNTL